MKSLWIVLLTAIISICTTSACFAISSGIIKNIPSYQCDDYNIVIPSEILEQNIANYLGYKKIRVQIQKYTKSYAYTQKIKNFIAERYPAPIYNQEALWGMLNNEKQLIILQYLEIDLRKRTAIVLEQSIWKTSEVRGIYTDDGTANIPGESYVYFIDESPEYGQIANDSIAFLESVKDVYLDPVKKRETGQREENYQKTKVLKDHLRSWSGDLTLIQSSDKMKVYMDIPSFQGSQGIYNGWLQFIPDDSLQLGSKEIKIYFRVDYYNSKMYALYQVLADKNGNETYNKVDPSEKWTMDDGKFVDTVLKSLSKKFGIQPTFRQLTGFDINNNPKKKTL